jgi:general secretion pathway protein D
VTMTVSSSLSERGSSQSTDADQGIILPTNERVVSTQLRTPSGEPIVLSGLIQRRIDDSQDKTPGLGDIPLLGWLFKKKSKEEKFNEMAIFIVPRILDAEDSGNPLSMDLESYYREFAFATGSPAAPGGEAK